MRFAFFFACILTLAVWAAPDAGAYSESVARSTQVNTAIVKADCDYDCYSHSRWRSHYRWSSQGEGYWHDRWRSHNRWGSYDGYWHSRYWSHYRRGSYHRLYRSCDPCAWDE